MPPLQARPPLSRILLEMTLTVDPSHHLHCRDQGCCWKGGHHRANIYCVNKVAYLQTLKELFPSLSVDRVDDFTQQTRWRPRQIPVLKKLQ
ncbi:hypothetical protein BGZ63DRAFT_397011 [Mariannaea sp. PMI_226]|nr:hypothetical protein BGZ63DRAFT_397011 [Mariannaea sp. PMI_226]